MALVVKNLPAAARDARDMGSIPGLGRSSGGGNGNPLQYSCLGNPMDKGAWWAAVCKGRKESDSTEATEHTRTYVIKYFSTAWFLMAVEYFFFFFPSYSHFNFYMLTNWGLFLKYSFCSGGCRAFHIILIQTLVQSILHILHSS